MPNLTQSQKVRRNSRLPSFFPLRNAMGCICSGSMVLAVFPRSLGCTEQEGAAVVDGPNALAGPQF